MKPRHSTLSSLVIHSLAGTAVADVCYSNFQNITIPADYAGVFARELLHPCLRPFSHFTNQQSL